MARTISTVNVSSYSFQDWIDRTNEAISALGFAVTANSTGEVTTGKAFVSGSFGSNTIYVGATNTHAIHSSNVVVSGTSPTLIDSFDTGTLKTVKYVISVKDNTTANSQATEILAMHDETSSYITEYATLVSNVSLASFSANINSTTFRLYATPTQSNTKFIFFRQGLIA